MDCIPGGFSLPSLSRIAACLHTDQVQLARCRDGQERLCLPGEPLPSVPSRAKSPEPCFQHTSTQWELNPAWIRAVASSWGNTAGCGSPVRKLQWIRPGLCPPQGVRAWTGLDQVWHTSMLFGLVIGPSLWMLLLDVLPVENTLPAVSGSSENSMPSSETSVSLAFV